jgi:hypothetical protein
VPEWNLLFWELAQHTPEELLGAEGPFMQLLAMVRGERGSPQDFRELFLQVVRRLEPLAQRDKMRWASC